MPKVTYVSHDGNRATLDLPAGTSVMLGAVGANLRGIVAECGGCLTCATCHVYVDEGWLAKLPAPQADELSMLEFTAAERGPNSRLSCQIRMTQALDGLVVGMPERQY